MLTGMVRIPAVTPPDISPMRLGRPIRVPAATDSVGPRAVLIDKPEPGWPRQEVSGAGAPGGSRLAPRHVPGLRLPPLEAPRRLQRHRPPHQVPHERRPTSPATEGQGRPSMRVIERVTVGKRGDGMLIRVEGQVNWFSVICVRGTQHEISTGTPDLKLAKRVHREKLDELAADRQGLKQFTTPQHLQLQFGSLLDDLASDYRVRRVKSLASVLSHLKPLRDHFGDWRALEINFRAIEAYVTTRREDEKSNATINRELELLRRALRLAHDRQLLPSIPKVRVLPENNTRQGFFERPDLEAVVAALPGYLQDFTRFAYLTGWMKGEIIPLKWTDVDPDAGAIRLRPEAAKTGRGRTVMLEGDLAELIDRRWQTRLLEKDGDVRVSRLVFPGAGEPGGNFRKAWAIACQAAGVPDKLFHDLRRTAARNMVRAGAPERVAMAVTGHLTRSMIDRYNIVSDDDLRMAAQKTTMYVDTLPTKRIPG